MEMSLIIEFALLVIAIIQMIVIIVFFAKNRQDSKELVLQKFIEYDKRLDKNESSLKDEFGRNREETNKSAKDTREELSASLRSFEQKFITDITGFTGLIDNKIKAITDLVYSSSKNNREELNKSIHDFEGKVSTSLKGFEDKFSNKIDGLTKETNEGLERNRFTVEKKLADIQKGNDEKLEKMRQTVDEKLHETLEKRLNESFQLVTVQLESVQKGLGEMHTLASGVGDLKKVLTNVKTRGNLGEIQLGAILEQILSSEQFDKNVTIKENSSERVEYVIKLPNKNDKDESLLLPVDSKFPNEDYVRLLDSYENAANLQPKEMEAISKQFENTVKKCAKDIRDKYIDPPRTTDFAFMFVPTEGLFAEIVRRTSLFETLQREFKITVVGPTNFVAVLNSLQMGFQTLRIEKRSSEVWKTLGAVKTSFRTFGESLAATKKKLVAATNEIDNVETKSRTIERKLKSVDELPVQESMALIGNLELGQDEEEE